MNQRYFSEYLSPGYEFGIAHVCHSLSPIPKCRTETVALKLRKLLMACYLPTY
jgi:hypothetical protein